MERYIRRPAFPNAKKQPRAAIQIKDGGNAQYHAPIYEGGFGQVYPSYHGMPFVTVTVVIRMLTAETALNTGQLVKDQDFTLFDAVGALEVCNLLYSSAIASPPLYAWNNLALPGKLCLLP